MTRVPQVEDGPDCRLGKLQAREEKWLARIKRAKASISRLKAKIRRGHEALRKIRRSRAGLRAATTRKNKSGLKRQEAACVQL